MNLSAPFIRRPIGTILLTIGIALAGAAAFFRLPVSPLPQVDFPVVSVSASLPGASPETMSSSVASPLEKHLGIIADVNEMTSRSSVGQTNIILQFGLNRNIDGAARDVQAAINAARVDLPATLRSNPTYNKRNPADAPIMILAMTSKTKTPGQIYDAANTIIQQQLSQVKGVGEVDIGGASLPAVRVELNPVALAKYGIALEDVRAALASANANRPKGVIEDGHMRFQLYTNDAGTVAKDYAPLVIAWRNGAPVRLQDIATVQDGVEDVHNLGLFSSAPPSTGKPQSAAAGGSSAPVAAVPGAGAANGGPRGGAMRQFGGQPAVLVIISRQPNANIIDTVERVKAKIPALQSVLPADIDMQVAADRTITIRASLADVERTVLISLLLVVGVVAFFLHNGRGVLIPSVAVTVSLLGAVGVMFMLGFSLDNLSLMALTIATGFVVDDAIVVMENITRHIENGMGRMEAALKGAQEVGFTVLSISISLVAVFLPIMLMGGIIGRLFREFALTLSTAILVSLVISLTTTPMMCAFLIRPPDPNRRPHPLTRLSEGIFGGMQSLYRRALTWSLDAGPVMLAVLVATIALNVYLFAIVPKGFFPQQDTGQLMGGLQTDQSSSFQISQRRLKQFVGIIQSDPAVQTVVAFAGRNAAGGFLQVVLKPKAERDASADQVVARLRPRLARVTGASLFLNPVQDFRMGGRQSNASYQYTLKADDLTQLRTWATKLSEAMKTQPSLQDVNTDQEDHGLQAFVTIDRDKAGRLGLSNNQIDNTLYDAFGQRQVSNIFKDENQYHVVMEVDPSFNQNTEALKNIYVTNGKSSANTVVTSASTTAGVVGSSSTSAQLGVSGAQAAAAGPTAPPSRGASTGTAVSSTRELMVPLSEIASWADSSTPTSVNHQDSQPATTISFNLTPGKSLSNAQAEIAQAQAQIGLPATVHGSFQGTAKVFSDSLSNEPILIAAALIAIYLVLGILYESYIHPLTVLSTLPSAGVGAAIALILFKTEFSIIAMIGVILLIGIVKKNAIMMIDFALAAERDGATPREAIYQAALTRFRPIMMTTFAAILGALPLAIGWGEGSELRRPLGIAIIGGLVVSQLLTLLTTPVVYLYLDKLRRRRKPRANPDPAPDDDPARPHPVPAA
ncbi:efflux RND transporter permease subunit [Caulobacter sp. KR2-114]|uniref:efflux RND transporter permease subunit n=1 Tax=Caulobacter sp. KR2-114 TaxID=3400912 RepID=UPI003BFFF04F